MNNKRSVYIENEDWISYNPDGAYKGLALIFLFLGCISFFTGIKFQPDIKNYEASKKKYDLNLSTSTVQVPEPENPLKEYWTIKGTIGDYTAGTAGTLFSLAGFVLLYLSFKKQTEANITQLNAYNHDKVEGRFFELIKLHRDNVSELKFTVYHFETVFQNGLNTKLRIPKDFENRQFFVAMLDQFKMAYDEVDHLFLNWPEDTIYNPLYLSKLKSNLTLVERKIDLKKLARIDLVYLIVFFGLSRDGQATIKSIVNSKYDKAYVEMLLNIVALKPKRDSDEYSLWLNMQKATNKVSLANEIILGHVGKHENLDDIFAMIQLGASMIPTRGYYSNGFEKFYGGHQFRVGHYFRHIFHTISFINNNSDLTSDEQYNYVKHLRGQLSTNEQILIFLNSLSQLGRIWELEDKKSGKSVERWKQIISDYNFIKNIPNDEIISGIKLSDFYPEIVYEGFEIKSEEEPS